MSLVQHVAAGHQAPSDRQVMAGSTRSESGREGPVPADDLSLARCGATGCSVSGTAASAECAVKHPDTVNQEMLKDRLGSKAVLTQHPAGQA